MVLYATRGRAKTQEAFLQSVRATLKRLEVGTSALKCRWLPLTTEEVVNAEAAGQSAAILPARTVEAADWRRTESPPDDGERTIVLPGRCREAALVTKV